MPYYRSTKGKALMMKVDAIVLMNEKQVWELNQADLELVKMECIKMARKCDQEQKLRAMAA